MAPQTRSQKTRSASFRGNATAIKKQENNSTIEKRKREDDEPSRSNSNAVSANKKQKSVAKPEGDSKWSKINEILVRYGEVPLSSLGLKQPTKPLPETVLAHLLNAMLTSARISHQIAAHSVKELINANYHHIDTLKNSSWQERTDVLTKGGYTHYREKTATALGQLADLISEKYDGDLNNLRKEAKDDPEQIRKLIKEIKGFGDVGVSIFCDSAQAIWPGLAPFMDARSLKTAQEVGLSGNPDQLFASVNKDATMMAKLCTALTEIRLGKHEAEFK